MKQMTKYFCVAFPFAVIVSFAGAGAASAQEGSSYDCLRSENPTVSGYATGAECPPVGFPYTPIVDITDSGLRAMDPYNDGCSGSIRGRDVIRDTGAAFDFRNACATHDYLADLQRFGAPGVPEASMDDWFLQDMKADCKERNFVARKACLVTAYEYRAGVQQGDYSTGDEINDGTTG